MGYVELGMSKEDAELLLKAVEAEAKRFGLEISSTMKRIKGYEEKYGMISEELGDGEDFIE